MRYSNYFIHTLFEVPKEAEIASHILLLRGSYMCPVAAGLYTLLPLGHRVAEKIKKIVREELDAIGGVELTMPVLNPAELWKKTNRYQTIGPELFRFKDRKDRDFVLAMTHEEVVTDVAKQFLRSYRDLPVTLYQIQTKIRDEARPRAGLLRVREFFMKDAYSFHRDFDDLDAYYPKIFNAYLRIFARCGLKSYPIEADSGIMGGTGSHEFMLESPNGEDTFVVCSRCGYSANTEKAVGVKPSAGAAPSGDASSMETIPTPGVKTIEDLAAFFGVGRDRFLKTVAYEADETLVLVAVRGDFEVSPTKLAAHLKAVHLDIAPEKLLETKGLHAGFISPVGIANIRIVTDTSVEDGAEYVAGGNAPDVHLKNVRCGRDFQPAERAEVAEVREGDVCGKCGAGSLDFKRGIELGHTFKLGTKYTAPETMDVTYLDASGEKKRVIMGCYGIGIERLLASTVEQLHDESGMIFPITVAPFQVIVSPLGKTPDIQEAGETIYKQLGARYEVLLDDRDDSPGVKLKDADLLGIPIRVVVSKKLLKNDEVEIKVRKTGETVICPRSELDAVVDRIAGELHPTLENLPWMEE